MESQRFEFDVYGRRITVLGVDRVDADRKLEKIVKRRGLGDVVGSVANPIAKIIDAAIGTKLSECGGCSDRKESLNETVPDIRHPFSSDRRTDSIKSK